MKATNINFYNDENTEDQTQFDTTDIKELIVLWLDFCKENNFDPGKIISVEEVEIEDEYDFGDESEMTWRQKICNRAEVLGWNARFYDLNNFQFSVFSPEGQYVNVEITAGCLAQFKDEIESYYNSYDPCEEASLWIKDGHGVNGAPYDLGTLLADMEWVKSELKKLMDVTYRIEED